MPLNVANWNDKQLDELADLLKASDYSAVASFIANNFLATGSRIMTDPTHATMRATVNGVDGMVIDLSSGIFVHNSLCSDIPSTQTVNILNSVAGTWGTGAAADDTQPRWDIIEVKNNEQVHTPLLRWFVDDSVDPNTYSQQLANTLIDKAYYDILVKHGTPGAIPIVPDPDAGYFTVAEIYVPADPTHANPILPANVYDTVGVSNKLQVPSWTATTRVLRIEFWSTLFSADHSMTTGYHKSGGWHIGADLVLSTANELNRLNGVGVSVTPTNLTTLTNGGNAFGLHTHGGVANALKFSATPVRLVSGTWVVGWTDINVTGHTAGDTAKAVLLSGFVYLYRSTQSHGWITLSCRKKGSAEESILPIVTAAVEGYTGEDEAGYSQSAAMLIVECDSLQRFQYRLDHAGGYSISWYIDLIGYFI